MSEPRKLYTGSASGGLDQEQYEAARRRAQQLAEQNARRRTVQQPMRTAQGRHISQRPVVPEQPAPAPAPPPVFFSTSRRHSTASRVSWGRICVYETG